MRGTAVGCGRCVQPTVLGARYACMHLPSILMVPRPAPHPMPVPCNPPTHTGNDGKTASFTTTTKELMDALENAGLGHLPASLDIAYTKKGRCGKRRCRQPYPLTSAAAHQLPPPPFPLKLATSLRRPAYCHAATTKPSTSWRATSTRAAAWPSRWALVVGWFFSTGMGGHLACNVAAIALPCWAP